MGRCARVISYWLMVARMQARRLPPQKSFVIFVLKMRFSSPFLRSLLPAQFSIASRIPFAPFSVVRNITWLLARLFYVRVKMAIHTPFSIFQTDPAL